MGDKYADAFAFLEHMGKTLEDDALAALEVRRMRYDPRESTLALRYGGIGRDIQKMAKLLHEAFLYETRKGPAHDARTADSTACTRGLGT